MIAPSDLINFDIDYDKNVYIKQILLPEILRIIMKYDINPTIKICIFGGNVVNFYGNNHILTNDVDIRIIDVPHSCDGDLDKLEKQMNLRIEITDRLLKELNDYIKEIKVKNPIVLKIMDESISIDKKMVTKNKTINDKISKINENKNKIELIESEIGGYKIIGDECKLANLICDDIGNNIKKNSKKIKSLNNEISKLLDDIKNINVNHIGLCFSHKYYNNKIYDIKKIDENNASLFFTLMYGKCPIIDIIYSNANIEKENGLMKNCDVLDTIFYEGEEYNIPTIVENVDIDDNLYKIRIPTYIFQLLDSYYIHNIKEGDRYKNKFESVYENDKYLTKEIKDQLLEFYGLFLKWKKITNIPQNEESIKILLENFDIMNTIENYLRHIRYILINLVDKLTVDMYKTNDFALIIQTDNTFKNYTFENNDDIDISNNNDKYGTILENIHKKLKNTQTGGNNYYKYKYLKYKNKYMNQIKLNKNIQTGGIRNKIEPMEKKYIPENKLTIDSEEFQLFYKRICAIGERFALIDAGERERDRLTEDCDELKVH